VVPTASDTRIPPKADFALEARRPPHRHQDNGAAGEAFGRTHRPIVVILVIPGRDPGIPADSAGWGDPRITSGDDEDAKSYPQLGP
jgi:hypothetical protein